MESNKNIGNVQILEDIFFNISKISNPFNNDTFLHDVLYLSILLETFVLHDQVFLSYQNQWGDFDKSAMEKYLNCPILNPWLQSSFIKVVNNEFDWERAKSDKDYLEKDENQVKEFQRLLNIDDNDLPINPTPPLIGDNRIFFARRDYDFEKFKEIKFGIELGIPIIANQDNPGMKIINSIDKLDFKNTGLLVQGYNEISESFKVDIKKLSVRGSSHKVYIPPISALIFSRSKNITDIFKIAVELRDEFKELRTAFLDYETKINDENATLRESINAFNEFESIISLITKNEEKSTLLKVTEWRDLTNLTKIIDGVSASDFSSLGSMLLGKPTKHIAKRLKIRKVKFLFQFVNNFLDIKGYATLVQKLFGREISKRQILYAKKNGHSNLTLK